MADRPGDEPDYDWLYGSRRRGGGSRGGADRPAADPDPTRVLPTMNRPQHSPQQSPPPADRPRTSRRPPRRPRRRHPLRWVWLLVLAWIVFLVAVPLFAWSKIDKVDASPSGARPANQPGTTYLLVGSDSRAGLTRKQELKYGTGKGTGQRTDTIMLLHTGAGPNLLMSIPRDSEVPVPGHGTTKINSAFAYGGAPLLVKTIEQDTGIRVDDYVEIGFAGFVDVVDAVGGIKICPKHAMKDPQANLDVQAGCQHAGGKKALAYARSRHTSALGDISRARHQREVVSAVGHKAVSPWSIINPVRYYNLANAGADSLKVGKDTSMLAAAKFAWAMTHVNGKNGLTCGVPISDLAVHWDHDRALRLFHLIQADRTADVTKSLCGPSGLASR